MKNWLQKFGWFFAFTAVFAAAAIWLFWGTWSCDVVPVMPDCQTNFRDWTSVIEGFWRSFIATGKFVPDDLKILFASPWVWVELQYVFAAYMAALGLAFFLRGKGLTALASYGAGLFLAFSGYWITLFSAGHLGWFRWMTYGVFAFGLIDRCLPRRGESDAAKPQISNIVGWALLGACVAWGSFYQPDLWLLFTIFTGAYFVWRAIAVRRWDWRGMIVAGAVFCVIGAPSFYSAFVNDLAARDQQISSGGAGGAGAGRGKSAADAAQKAEERWIFVTNWSLPPDEIAEALRPRLNGDTSCVLTQALGAKAGRDVKPYTGALGRAYGAKSGNYRQHSLYLGVINCLAAFLAVIFVAIAIKSKNRQFAALKSRNSEILFFAAAAVVFLLFACGRYCEPVYRLVYALPFGDYLRGPVKWYHLFEFCVAVLAGYGLDAVQRLIAARFDQSASAGEKTAALELQTSGFKLQISTLLLAAVVVAGVAGLVNVDRRYCAPVDMRAAKAKNAVMQMTFLHKSQFANPQLAAMANAGLLQPLAYFPGNREVYLVGALEPRGPKKSAPMPPWTLPTWLGLVSFAASAVVLGGAGVCKLKSVRKV